ncbi:hypothetical protein H2203_002707 [Taxawa tesnikishii (nom. ined.)]|nr:hypothetical protein H2203_002707 [Dothideales sp. JES 119]
MKRDKYKGPGYWSGCHSFQNIIFDGQRPDWNKPRNGALKQGGKYWYYYLVDDAYEHCDPHQPFTTACPLLPGQAVNLLDVPIEVVEVPRRTRSASADITSILPPPMTYDPADSETEASKVRRPVTPARQEDQLANKPNPPKSPRWRPKSLPTPNSQDDVRMETSNHQSPILKAFGPCSSEQDIERPTTRYSTATDHASLISRPSSTSRGQAPQLGQCQTGHKPPSLVPDQRPLSRKSAEHVQEAANLEDAQVNDILQAYQHSGGWTQVDLLATPEGLGLNWAGYEDHYPAQRQMQQRLQLESAAPSPQRGRSLNFSRPIPTPSPRPSRPSPIPPSISESQYSHYSTACPSPISEFAGFDMSSPTFTADTVSSTGFASPVRLSGSYTRPEAYHGAHVSAFPTQNNGQSDTDDPMDTVSRRLSRLQTSPRCADGATPPDDFGNRGNPEDYQAYSLPLLNGQSTPPSAPAWKPAPTMPQAPRLIDYGNGLDLHRTHMNNGNRGGNVVEDIISELGYLGDVIS